jgi:hypothetical protein
VEKPPPYLTLVDPSHDPQADEFIPLPYYPWDERPAHLPLDHDECATAIHLAFGSIANAAAILKVPLFRLSRSVRASPRLQKIQSESLSLSLDKATAHVLDSLDAIKEDGTPNIARREWATTKLLQSRLAQGHPLSPAPAGQQSSASLTLSQTGPTKSMTFRWKTADDALTQLEQDDINPDG